jgi:hypothetical protein
LFNLHHYQVSTPECLRLLELKFPVKLLIERLYHDEAYDMPGPEKTFLATSRMNYRLTMEELEQWQFLFLKSCRDDILLTDAINATAIAANIPASSIIADLCFVLPIFQEKGFIVLNDSV